MFPNTFSQIIQRFRIQRKSKINTEHASLGQVAANVVSIPKQGLVVFSGKVEAPWSGEALLVYPQGQYRIGTEWPLPQIRNPNEVVIRVQAVGLNPIDWMSVAYNFCLPRLPWITGREASGVVEQVGTAVSSVEVGQRVWTSTYYKDIRAGCFQERVVVPEHTVLPIPRGASLEQAATLGVAGITAAMVLWKWLGLEMPPVTASEKISVNLSNKSSTGSREGPNWLLIWGGSTATGQYLTQLGSLSNVSIVTVCSAATQSLSYSLGATLAVCRDGKSHDQVVEEIRARTGDGIRWAVDLVGKETSTACMAAVSTKLPVRFAPLATPMCGSPAHVEICNVEMKQFVLERENKRFADVLNRLVAFGQVQFPELRVIEGGLRRVEEGLKIVRESSLGGRKLVVRM